ncbi:MULTISPECIES: ArsR/SmtB family transcription factor [unclassified Sphingomonas]|uniref:ArsR/SmtB family transcription factor n=1 Tax=unclassified Sphingomonas TaxID=196159 RepID=UPI0006FFC4B1|nr:MULTISPECIES: metalloregulator ArsR/SmtB family transcription factor [unclassified Sphingomonas]KQX19471.1 ArsR family transcriptional regulator [Sphingomonas sp. Root1294]KQY65672.1 ArsR family transcriptional regulator [Sphingomonas sp. Root50]KRB95024.1 ArsR family transcriptional regulator [Sphingomonas sp. Root720]
MRDPLSDAQIEAIAQAMRTLGHETRLRLVDTIFTQGEKSVGELEALTGIGQPGLSQQLAVLRKAELVSTRRVAKQVYYSVAADALDVVVRFLGGLANLAPGEAAHRTGQPTSRRARGSAAMFAKIL